MIVLDVRALTGAAYASAKAKALRPSPVAPAVAPRRAVMDMSEEEYLAEKPKAISSMTDAEYAVAKRAAIVGR